MGWYNTAQVCLNGHVITARTASREHTKKFCDRCGGETITNCPSCEAAIKGEYEVDAVISFSGMEEPPKFCDSCGKPYPWTEKLLQAAEELAEEFEDLTPDERKTLTSSIHDVITQNPHQSVAEIRIKKLGTKIGEEGAGFLRDLLRGYVSEELLKSLFGG